jgi:glycosyltransferase involved in cell wall biosynthesis
MRFMKPQLRISVVIPVFNGSRTLRRTLETVRRQKESPLEVIVVDDASTEDISDMVRELGARHHRLPMNVGPAMARTEGARLANAPVVLFTDSDVWLPEGLIAGIRKAFEENDCECVQGVFSRQCPHSNFLSQYKNFYNRYVLSQLPVWINTTYTSVTAVRKDFFFECGGFDQSIHKPSVEDRTLGQNIVTSGGRILLDKSLEVIHNKRMTLKGFIRNQFHRSRDLAKLLIRQKESGFHKKGSSFGTHSRGAMMRLPFVFLLLCSFCFFLASLWGGLLIQLLGALMMVGVLGGYSYLSWPWIEHLAKEKGGWFALRAWPVDLLDAIVSGLGVACGLFESKVLGRKY